MTSSQKVLSHLYSLSAVTTCTGSSTTRVNRKRCVVPAPPCVLEDSRLTRLPQGSDHSSVPDFTHINSLKCVLPCGTDPLWLHVHSDSPTPASKLMNPPALSHSRSLYELTMGVQMMWLVSLKTQVVSA